MKILQFAFEGATEYLPHNCVPNSVLYPGTHDNDTCWGWFNVQNPNVQDFRPPLSAHGPTGYRMANYSCWYASASRIFIVPMQRSAEFRNRSANEYSGHAVRKLALEIHLGSARQFVKDRREELREYARLYER